MVPGFSVSAECRSIWTIEHNASPYWQDNGWPLNKDGSHCVPYFWRIFFHGARNRALSDLLERFSLPLHSTSCQWYLCFGTWPRHQTRAPWLGPPRLKKAKSNFFTNRNILHTLKKEQLDIMLLYTSRTMDDPWIKTVPIVSHIFWRIFFDGTRNRGLSDLLERWIRKPHPRNVSSKYAPTESFWG